MSKYRILHWQKNYPRDDFDCGISELNEYLKKYANQDQLRRVARVFILCPQNSDQIIGFYTLSASSIKASSLPEKIAKKLPRYPTPVTLLGRLAVDKNYLKIGIGRLLLVDAIKRVIKASEQIAVFALVVDAKNEQAKVFYSRYGFKKLIDYNNRLFIPLKTALSSYSNSI